MSRAWPRSFCTFILKFDSAGAVGMLNDVVEYFCPPEFVPIFRSLFECSNHAISKISMLFSEAIKVVKLPLPPKREQSVRKIYAVNSRYYVNNDVFFPIIPTLLNKRTPHAPFLFLNHRHRRHGRCNVGPLI